MQPHVRVPDMGQGGARHVIDDRIDSHRDGA